VGDIDLADGDGVGEELMERLPLRQGGIGGEDDFDFPTMVVKMTLIPSQWWSRSIMICLIL
jgi:hypothetical protein